MAFRFIHTADWQLGQGFDRFPPDAAAELRKARLDVVEHIGLLAAEGDMDAILVAGDGFDQIGVADKTLRQFLIAAESFPGPWVLLPGNHDPALAESPWSRLRRMLDAIRVALLERHNVDGQVLERMLPYPLAMLVKDGVTGIAFGPDT